MNDSKTHYDGELQMVVDRPREVNLGSLRFLRWLAENGRLEHRVFGASCGEFAEETVIDVETKDTAAASANG